MLDIDDMCSGVAVILEKQIYVKKRKYFIDSLLLRACSWRQTSLVYSTRVLLIILQIQSFYLTDPVHGQYELLARDSWTNQAPIPCKCLQCLDTDGRDLREK